MFGTQLTSINLIISLIINYFAILIFFSNQAYFYFIVISSLTVLFCIINPIYILIFIIYIRKASMINPYFGYLLLVSFLILTTNEKRVNKMIPLTDFKQQILTQKFLARFDFGPGQSNITIRYGKDSTISTSVLLNIGLLEEQNFYKFRKSATCQQKEKFYKETYKLSFQHSYMNAQVININQPQREHIWFLYAYQCSKVEITQQNKNINLIFDITMWNNNSHLGQDEKMMWSYVGVMLLWVLLLIKIIKPVFKSLLVIPITTVQTFLYFGYLILGLAIFYRLIDFIVKQFNGDDIVIFMTIHLVLKNIIQGFMVTVLLAIGWGWSLTHVHFNKKFILFALILTIYNIMSYFIRQSEEQFRDSYFSYYHFGGKFMFTIKIMIFIGFAIGCLQIANKSVGKQKHFIIKYAKFGSIYFLAWPGSVIFCCLCIPKYLMNQFVIISEQALHIIMNAYICWLFAVPDSSYKKVSLKNTDEEMAYGILPSYRK